MNRENIINIINAADSNYKAEATDTMKNGIMRLGIVMGSGNVRPTFYVDGRTETDEEIARDIIDQFRNLDIPKFNPEVLTEDYAMQHAVLCVASKVQDDAVSKKWLDLRQYVRVEIDDEASYVVKDSMGFDKNKLFKAAKENLMNEIEIKNLSDILADMVGMSRNEVPDNPMWCTRRKGGKNFSAGVLAVKDILDKFCDDHNIKKIIVIPSSIHEILLVNADELDKNAADDMVKSVNTTTVSEFDRLSDHAYIYDRTERRMTV